MSRKDKPRRVSHHHLRAFFIAFLTALVVVGVVFVAAYPTFAYHSIGQRVLRDGAGISDAPVPPNTLVVAPGLAAPGGGMLSTGANVDTVYSMAWLELGGGPLQLSVPDMGNRYYALQFINSNTGENFAYVGSRSTGSTAGKFLVTGPGWSGTVPGGMKQVPCPTANVLVIGRVFAQDVPDATTAVALSKQITFAPYSG